jgi:hypothetical protein
MPKHYTIKAYRGYGAKNPCILDLGAGWRWVIKGL